MNPYATIVRDYARSFREGRSFPMGGLTPTTGVTPRPGAPKALIFSPHPDDECIIGGLALRLLRECGWNIQNVAVTQGSNRARQSERWTELQAACAYMGFGLIQTSPNGLEKVTPKCRSEEPAVWAPMVRCIADILRREAPAAILVPHVADWNGSHIGTHHLVMDALATLGPDFQTVLIETEYWGQMTRPNLMVEISENDHLGPDDPPQPDGRNQRERPHRPRQRHLLSRRRGEAKPLPPAPARLDARQRPPRQ
jgi:LmbE family N-acetylglucosaminyl deacetylase